MYDLMADASVDSPGIPVSGDDLAVIVYTSGTTDEPKGVCLTHTNLVANALQTRHWVPDLQYGQEIFLSVLPFLHSYGMTSAMNIPIAMGATMILLPAFELEQVLEVSGSTSRPSSPACRPYTAINHAPTCARPVSIKACISGALCIEVRKSLRS
jgi:long-chain acyl-CoA synthetase